MEEEEVGIQSQSTIDHNYYLINTQTHTHKGSGRSESIREVVFYNNEQLVLRPDDVCERTERGEEGKASRIMGEEWNGRQGRKEGGARETAELNLNLNNRSTTFITRNPSCLSLGPLFRAEKCLGVFSPRVFLETRSIISVFFWYKKISWEKKKKRDSGSYVTYAHISWLFLSFHHTSANALCCIAVLMQDIPPCKRIFLICKRPSNRRSFILGVTQLRSSLHSLTKDIFCIRTHTPPQLLSLTDLSAVIRKTHPWCRELLLSKGSVIQDICPFFLLRCGMPLLHFGLENFFTITRVFSQLGNGMRRIIRTVPGPRPHPRSKINVLAVWDHTRHLSRTHVKARPTPDFRVRFLLKYPTYTTVRASRLHRLMCFAYKMISYLHNNSLLPGRGPSCDLQLCRPVAGDYIMDLIKSHHLLNVLMSADDAGTQAVLHTNPTKPAMVRKQAAEPCNQADVYSPVMILNIRRASKGVTGAYECEDLQAIFEWLQRPQNASFIIFYNREKVSKDDKNRKTQRGLQAGVLKVPSGAKAWVTGVLPRGDLKDKRGTGIMICYNSCKIYPCTKGPDGWNGYGKLKAGMSWGKLQEGERSSLLRLFRGLWDILMELVVNSGFVAPCGLLHAVLSHAVACHTMCLVTYSGFVLFLLRLIEQFGRFQGSLVLFELKHVELLWNYKSLGLEEMFIPSYPLNPNGFHTSVLCCDIYMSIFSFVKVVITCYDGSY
ncbi:hypothetical protein VP01_147g4 [Puccinia sorghi]|uniref:Uncharacterized protein n=1 Tax=Puccinia sorghi TaxID=27349 RepID=A0A0L6VK58_9BASI|nr:hypothetical protein VP01_147g4 [Puccinia sorghi]